MSFETTHSPKELLNSPNAIVEHVFKRQKAWHTLENGVSNTKNDSLNRIFIQSKIY